MGKGIEFAKRIATRALAAGDRADARILGTIGEIREKLGFDSYNRTEAIKSSDGRTLVYKIDIKRYSGKPKIGVLTSDNKAIIGEETARVHEIGDDGRVVRRFRLDQKHLPAGYRQLAEDEINALSLYGYRRSEEILDLPQTDVEESLDRVEERGRRGGGSSGYYTSGRETEISDMRGMG